MCSLSFIGLFPNSTEYINTAKGNCNATISLSKTNTKSLFPRNLEFSPTVQKENCHITILLSIDQQKNTFSKLLGIFSIYFPVVLFKASEVMLVTA